MNPTDIHPGRVYGNMAQSHANVRKRVLKIEDSVIGKIVVYEKRIFGICTQHQTTLAEFAAWARSELPPKSMDEDRRSHNLRKMEAMK